MKLANGTVEVLTPPLRVAPAAAPTCAPVVVLPVAGPPGPSGESAGRPTPLVFTGIWSSFSAVHPFPFLPDVWLIDAGGTAVESDVEYPDATHVALSFPVPFAGTIIIG